MVSGNAFCLRERQYRKPTARPVPAQTGRRTAICGNQLRRAIRLAFLVSGFLSVAGLSGVAVGDLQPSNIGIIGYMGAFPLALALTVVLFERKRGEGGALRIFREIRPI